MENDITLKFKYVDDVVKTVEDLMYHGYMHIRIDRDKTNHHWVVTYEEA